MEMNDNNLTRPGFGLSSKEEKFIWNCVLEELESQQAFLANCFRISPLYITETGT